MRRVGKVSCVCGRRRDRQRVFGVVELRGATGRRGASASRRSAPFGGFQLGIISASVVTPHATLRLI
jgi:hypothetical protein